MKTTLAAALLVLPLIFSSTLHAQGVDDRGIRAAASELDHAIDEKDWERVRDLLLDEVTIALPGKERITMSAEALIANWQANLHSGKMSFHQRGSEVATFDGADSAVLRSKGYARFEVIGIAGEDTYEFWADYVHELDRHEDGWRVRHIAYVPRLENGNLAVMTHRLPAESKEGDAMPSGEQTDADADAPTGTVADGAEDATAKDEGQPDATTESGEAGDAGSDTDKASTGDDAQKADAAEESADDVESSSDTIDEETLDESSPDGGEENAAKPEG